MSEISTFVEISIDRATKTPSQASFSIPAVIGQFATSKTVDVFDRARAYRNPKAMRADGWSEADSIFNACSAIWKQNLAVAQIIVGRLDSGDATLAAGLSLIADANSNWFSYVLVGTYTPTVNFSTAPIAGNIISATVNGIKIADVTYATSASATLAAWGAAVVTKFPGTVVNVTGNAVTLTLAGNELVPVVTVAGGVSQPKATVSWAQDGSKLVASADWVETQKKVFLYDTNDPLCYNSSSALDIFSVIKAKGYDNSCGIFNANPGEYAAASWMGEFLPYDPGSSTYAFRTLKGVTANVLGPTKEDVILSKNGSYYTESAGISHTFEGKSASGEFLDIVVGIYWLEARIKERVFAGRVNNRKVPLSDPGLEAEGTLIKGVLSEGEQKHVLVSGSSSVTVPKAADISLADKAARYAPGFEFSGLLEGAIHKSKINGYLSL